MQLLYGMNFTNIVEGLKIILLFEGIKVSKKEKHHFLNATKME